MDISPNDFFAFQAYHKKYKKVYALEFIKYGYRVSLAKYCGAPSEGAELMVDRVTLIGPNNMKKRRYSWKPTPYEGDIRDLVISRFKGFSDKKS